MKVYILLLLLLGVCSCAKNLNIGEDGVDEPSNDWNQQAEKICFNAKGNKFGTFRLNQDGILTALKLQYLNGEINCRDSNSRWGCTWERQDDKKKVGIAVTDEADLLIFPANTGNPNYFFDSGLYYLPGYNPWSDFIVFTDMTTPMYGRNGQQLRVWFKKDWDDEDEDRIRGQVCVKVYAKFA